jgi:hypothetical protein
MEVLAWPLAGSSIYTNEPAIQRFVDLRFVDLLTTALLSAELGINVIVLY